MNARFKNRWHIRGTLTLEHDMYLGDGDIRSEERKVRDRTASSDIATVARDVAGRPTIPGAALKGALRAYLTESQANEQAVLRLFGKVVPQADPRQGEQDEAKGGEGGRLDVRYARLQSPPEDAQNGARPVIDSATFVAIDRTTRAADDRLLFAADFVLRGTVFDVEFVGYDLEDDDVALLLAGLNGFSPKSLRPIRLGANRANHCGVATWQKRSIRRIKPADLVGWLRQDSIALESIGADLTSHNFNLPTLTLPPLMRLTFELRFHGPVLVSDPHPGADSDASDQSPRRTPDGRILIPSSSMHGAFRSQAERIARTLDPNAGGAPGNNPQPNGIIECAYGYSGRCAWIEFTDFVSIVSAGNLHRREFVAIDRFTGGSAEHLKFNADVYDPPGGAVFTGAITLDLGRLQPADLALFALTLRDWCEGDIRVGKGSAKGWGHECAQVNEIVESASNALREAFLLKWPQGILQPVATPRFGLTAEIQSVFAAAVKVFQTSFTQKKAKR